MPVPQAGSRPERQPPRRIRWGLPDALIVWVAALLAATFVAAPAYNNHGGEPSPLYSFAVILPAQQIATLVALVLISRRKGRGSLRADFGLTLRSSDARAVGWGVGLQFLLIPLVGPLLWLSDKDEPQKLLEDIKDSRGAAPVVFFILSAVLMAPLVEELLYRGLLLRALLRRFDPAVAVFVSAVVFALVHLAGDPGALDIVPALAALGIVLGIVAIRTGDLSTSILIHAGFNLTTTLLFVIFGMS